MSLPRAVVVEPEAADVAIATHRTERLAGSVARRKHPILLLLALSVGLLLPILIWGLPRTSDDGETHVRWQYFYGRQMWDGDPFPRWIRDIADGFGSPAFFIYAPLPHYVASLLAPVSDSIEWIQHRLALAIMLASFLGAVGCYTWFKQITRERNTALIGAMAYTMAPYHLFVDSYFRGAYSELWALGLAPFAFAGMHLLASRRRAGVALIVAGVSGLLLSHPPTALILMPLYLVYACLLAALQRRWDMLAWTGAAIASACLIAGVYLGTALTQQSYIHTSELYTGYFNFYNWLIFNPNPVSKRAFNLSGAVQAAMTLALAGAPLLMQSRRNEWRRLALAAVIGTCILSFMMTSFSAAIWTLVPFAQKIQFPWRLQTAQTLLLALSTALFLRAAGPGLLRKTGLGAAAWSPWFGSLPLMALFAVNLAMFHHAPSRFDVDAPVRTLETTEYTLGDTIGNARYFAAGDKMVLGSGSASITLLRWDPRRIELEVDAAATSELLARQFTYTGWTCAIVGVGVGAADACRIRSTGSGDILRVQVAPGRQHIELVMPETMQERIGKLASAVGLVLAAALVVVAGRRRR